MAKRPRAVLAATCLGYFLIVLDAMIVTVALPVLRRDLDAGLAGLQWVVDAYALTLASSMLIGGALGDRIGNGRVFMTGMLVFGAGSALCGAAPGLLALVAARGLQGVGAALMLPPSLALIAHSYPDETARARALGVWAAVASLAGFAAPLIGGVLVTAAGWRAIFLVNVPIVIAGAVLTARSVAESPRDPGRPLHAGTQALAAVVLAALVFAVIEWPEHGLTPLIAGALATCAAGAVGIWLARRGSRARIYPAGLFRRPGVVVPLVVAVTHTFAGWGAVFVVMLHLQGARGYTALGAGLAMLPLPLLTGLVAVGLGRLPGRATLRRKLSAGLLLCMTALALLAVVSTATPLTIIGIALAVYGAGNALVLVAMTGMLLGTVAVDASGLASATLSTARHVGLAIGIAVMGSLARAGGMPPAMAAGFAVTALGLLVMLCAAALSDRVPGSRPGMRHRG